MGASGAGKSTLLNTLLFRHQQLRGLEVTGVFKYWKKIDLENDVCGCWFKNIKNTIAVAVVFS